MYGDMPVGLELPEVEHERFEHPPLKTMLGQVRFPPILAVEDGAFLAPFQEAVRSEYPELGTQQQVGLLMTPEGAFQTDASKQWRVTTADQTWAIILAVDFVTLEASASPYTHFGDFRERFAFVWDAVTEFIRPTRGLQQGLRYVNHIEREVVPSQWRDWINPELLGIIGVPSLGDEIEQAISDLRFRRSDGLLVMKHGIVPAGPERKSGYLLDFDYYTQELNDLDTESVLARFDAFHDTIYPLFRWCLTEETVSAFRTG